MDRKREGSKLWSEKKMLYLWKPFKPSSRKPYGFVSPLFYDRLLRMCYGEFLLIWQTNSNTAPFRMLLLVKEREWKRSCVAATAQHQQQHYRDYTPCLDMTGVILMVVSSCDVKTEIRVVWGDRRSVNRTPDLLCTSFSYTRAVIGHNNNQDYFILMCYCWILKTHSICNLSIA